MSDKRIDIFQLLRNEKKLSKILVYVSREIENDPYEHTKTLSFLNPATIEALVTPISFEALRWKYWAQMPLQSVQILCEPKYENLLKLSDKIVINNIEYKCYKDDNKGFAILRRDDHIVAVLEIKR